MAKASDINELACDASARTSIALVLRTRLGEMCALRTAALEWSDPEGVHDMRVASRRLRSALRDFAPYLRRKLPRRRLRKLADALGRVRDEDVAISALEELARAAEPDITLGLSLLIAARQRRRERARVSLALALAEPALEALQAKFLRRLERAAAAKVKRAEDEAGDADGQTFRRAGREIIADLTTELRAGGRALYQPHDVDGIHRQRIVAKRLRYALELFAQCWGEWLTNAADEIAMLQKALGELHDCDVWIAALGKRLARTGKAKQHEAQAIAAQHAVERKAAVWLLSRFVKERAKYFRDALDCWEALETNEFCAKLLAALEQAPGVADTQAAPHIVSISSPPNVE